MKTKSLVISSIVALIIAIMLNLSKILYMEDSTLLNLLVTSSFVVFWVLIYIDGFSTKSSGFFKYSLVYWLLSVLNFGVLIIGYTFPSIFKLLMIPGTILSLFFSTPLYGCSFIMPKPLSPLTYSWCMLGLSAIFSIIALYGTFGELPISNTEDNDTIDDLDDLDDLF